jgi:hypothetical protein
MQRAVGPVVARILGGSEDALTNEFPCLGIDAAHLMGRN